MDDIKPSYQESLTIISEMVNRTKQNLARGGSTQMLLWGWTIPLLNFGHFALDIAGFAAPYVVWILIVPITIVSIFIGIRQGRLAKVRGHLDKVYSNIWLALGGSMFLVVAFMAKLNFHHSPIILLLAACGTFITGQMLRYKPVIYGGIFLFVSTFVAFNVPVTYQYLIAGIGTTFGYLLPGYMLKRTESA